MEPTIRGGDNKHKSRKLVVISMMLLSLGTYLWFFWFQSLMVFNIWYGFRKVPVVHMVPAELNDRSVNLVSGTKLSSFGYEFEVPWQDVELDKIQRKVMMLIPFHSGLEILVGHGSTHDLIDTVISETKTNPQEFRSKYLESSQSDYDFLNLVLNTTPSQVRLLDSKQEVGRRSSLIILKAIIVPGDSGIFRVDTPDLHGFQYGDPAKNPRKIMVTLYSAKNNVEFTFARKDMKPLAISQADINRIVQTVRESNTTGGSNVSASLSQ
jgi:hypothetical protein